MPERIFLVATVPFETYQVRCSSPAGSAFEKRKASFGEDLSLRTLAYFHSPKIGKRALAAMAEPRWRE
jgi:hypothetical protein